MVRSRTIRAVLAYGLLCALFLGACTAVFVIGQDESHPKANKTDDKPKPALPPKDTKPRGPDELFAPLPDDGLYEGKAPAQTWKAVVLTVPNPASDNDRPDQDLPTNERYSAGGFMLMLDQQLNYLPQIYTETNTERLKRRSALLRQGDAPRAGAGVQEGAHSKSLDEAAAAFNAGLVFAISFVPGNGDTPPKGAAFRYSPDHGIERVVAWDFGKLGKPEPDSMMKLLQTKVAELCDDVGATPGDDGKLVQVPHAPIPRLAADDKAMREFVKLRDGLEGAEAAKAWLAFDSLMKRDPGCGRAALYAMEIFRALSDRQPGADESIEYLKRAIKVGREGVRLAPNDVQIRGRLCWIATNYFNRFEWSQTGLKQAMRVQPANFDLIGWWLTCYELEDRPKQAQWLIENALPVIHDGRVELALGNLYYGSGKYAEGVEWYRKGLKIAPRDHELQLSLGLCANYLGERMAKRMKREQSRDAFATSSEALATCQDIDPQTVKWVYEYYVRATTHKFKRLPTNPKTLERLFLSQAAFNGLTSNRRTGEWDRLVKDVIALQRRALRRICREAKPGDPLYEMKLIARLQFDLVDQDNDDLIYTLWLMRGMGMRPDIYVSLIATYGPVVKEYKPKHKDGKQG